MLRPGSPGDKVLYSAPAINPAAKAVPLAAWVPPSGRPGPIVRQEKTGLVAVSKRMRDERSGHYAQAVRRECIVQYTSNEPGRVTGRVTSGTRSHRTCGATRGSSDESSPGLPPNRQRLLGLPESLDFLGQEPVPIILPNAATRKVDRQARLFARGCAKGAISVGLHHGATMQVPRSRD